NSHDARETFYLIDLKKPANNINGSSNCLPVMTMWEAPEKYGSYVNAYMGNKKTILSIAAFEKDNIVYSLPLIIDFNDKKLELGLYRVQKDYDVRPYSLSIEKSSSRGDYNVLITRNHIQLNEIEINEQIFSSSSNEKDYQKAADLAKGSISSYSFKITNDGKLKVCFVINISPNGTNFSPHRGAKFVLIEIDKNKDIKYSIKNLFSNNHDLSSEDELWHGYFVNDVITKHGINSTLNNENLTPFVGVGWSQKRLGDSYPWFVWLVKNPFSKSNDYDFNPYTNSNDFRVYCVNGGINNNQIYPGSINSHSQYGLSQFNVGFPILEYDENKNDSSFNRNILFTWNNQQKAIVINQKNYKSFQAPTLGYYTRLKVNKNSFSYSDLGLSSNDFSRLTKDDIKNRIKNNLLLNNISNSIHTFDKLFFDYENGQIIFTLKINNYFNAQGQLKKDNNFKLENITITGLTKIKYQILPTSQNLYNSNYTDYKNRNSSFFVANNISSYNDKNNDQLYWSLREIVWSLVTKTKLGFKLKKSIDFGSNQQQTHTNFDSFFKSFLWTKCDSKKGQISASFTINKEYLYVDESQEDKNFTITFNGLRKIEDTKLKSNTKDNSITDSALSSFNIPHNGTKLDQKYDYLSPETKVISEDQLKQLFIEKIFNPHYQKANEENGFSTGFNDLVENLAFNAKLSTQNLHNPLSKPEWLLNKNDILLSNYEFLPAQGILSVELRLKFWNKDGNWKTLEENESIENAPSARWYVSGFRTDNIETKFNQDQIWELEDLKNISIHDIKNNENKEFVENILQNYLAKNKNLVQLPFWLDPNVVLSNPDIEYELNSVELDSNNSRLATLKVKLKNNTWIINDQNNLLENVDQYQNIIITGFLDLTPIKLKTEWLKRIKLSGNTKNLVIENEEEVFKDVLFTDRKFLKIEYSVEGLNQWFDKDEFIEKLDQLNGSLDKKNWIIKREDIKARFAIKQEYVENVFIEVDDTIINSQNLNLGISIIDQNVNSQVKGYINIDQIIDVFKSDNFEVHGTDKNPKLIIKNPNDLNYFLSQYNSSDVFEILYRNNQISNFDSNNAIWKSGSLELKEINDLNLEILDYFALCFKPNSNYEVYKNGQIQKDGYILESPNIKMLVSIEIENPLIGQRIKVNFKDENNQPKFFQNEGGFSIEINSKTFDDFIKNDSGLEEEKQKAIELAYYVSDHELNQQEINQIISKDKLYEDNQDKKYNNWKTLETHLPNKNLNLLVNDYVLIILRVKKEFLISESNPKGYLLNEQNLYPIQQRVYGYKVKIANMEINFDSMELENVGQLESNFYPLDGYARLKNLSLNEDQDKNYLGAAIKINYFNEFYKDSNNKILTSASGDALVKREKGFTYKEYKDQNGKVILDPITNQTIKLELDQNFRPTKIVQKQKVTNSIELEQYLVNSFRVPEKTKDQLEYNFFQNQEIEFEFVNKKGQAPENEYDYYVDQENVKMKYTFNNIKFPINNDLNIRYEFNSKEFIETISNPNNIKNVYQNSLDPSKEPINGQSKLIKMFSIIRKENNQEDKKLTTLDQINQQIKSDFSNQVKLLVTHFSIDGIKTIIEDGDISKIDNLKNGDRFKVEIISTSDDLIFINQPSPLIFTVSGLYEEPIDSELLKYLRVKQGGTVDGQGSFNIFINDPNQINSNSDLKELLDGYKFLVRVWDKTKKIKHNWTDNFVSINNLNNGDKVEWKLVSPNGLPLVDSYYNTIANLDKHNANENKYSFIQINQEGFSGKNISKPIEIIGKNPEDPNAYPEDSGLLISGLKSKDDFSYTTIEYEEFTRVMDLMDFKYSGINGRGNMISSKNACDIKLNVVARNSETFTLDYLIKNNYVSFYCNNSPFNWNQVKDENGNWLTSPGTLKNGDI
ncbi:MAG: hypothetical protein IKF44_01280, partial [Mycoplasmataceae bacterium]|nr:hypothetical protein [Mycoplasmataceae bacterium]